MLTAKIEYDDGPRTTFFFRKPEVAAFFAVASVAKDDVVVQVDPSTGSVYAMNPYSILRVVEDGFCSVPGQPRAVSGVSMRRSADFLKRVAAGDYLAVCPSIDGGRVDMSIVHRKSKEWVPVDGMDLDDMDVVSDARFASAKAPIHVSDLERMLGESGGGCASSPAFSVSSTMFDVLAKVGKASNDKVVSFRLVGGQMDPIVARLVDKDDGCTWSFLLMPVRPTADGEA